MIRKKNKNQISMKNEDNACIRYLMKEMDPSEELLMERAMMEDDDLLIEVESLRQTLARLDDLPDMDPPAHVREAVLEQAARKAEERNKPSVLSVGHKAYRIAAAAVFLITCSVGGYWYMQQEEAAQTTGESASSASMQVQALSSSSAAERQASPPSSVASASSDQMQNITQKPEPWVDRQDIIHFTEQYQQGSTEFDSMLQTTTQKLVPLSDPFYLNNRPRSLQMTGTGNQ